MLLYKVYNDQIVTFYCHHNVSAINSEDVFLMLFKRKKDIDFFIFKQI